MSDAHRETKTSDLIKLLINGSRTPEEHEEVVEELDRRLPPPGVEQTRSAWGYGGRHTE